MVQVPAWLRGHAPASEGLSGVHKTWSSSERRYILINAEGLTLEEWLAAAGIDRTESEDRHLEAWKDGEDPTEWRASVKGKPARGWKISDDLKGLSGKKDDRPYSYDIKSANWDAAARKIIETINGVGQFHFDSLQDALDSGPYASSREFVLKHLHWLKWYYEVYDGKKIENVFRRRFR